MLRQAAAGGGFAAVLRSGDPDRGAILLHVVRGGEHVDLLERQLAADYSYRWARQPSHKQGVAALIADKARIDPDSWLIELDIPDAERFVAEMISVG